MLVISTTNNECVNMEIEASSYADFINHIQGAVPGLTEPKPATPLVSTAVDIWVSTLSYFNARGFFIMKKAGELFNRPNQHKSHYSILPNTLANVEGKRRIQS